MTLSQKHKTTLKHCNEPKLVWILLQQTDYYPYGLPKAKSIAPEINPFKYSGKELYTDLSLTHYDFAARLQLPAIGLFQRPDPKASDFHWLNSYTFCGGDPVNKVDKNGKEWKIIEDRDGKNIHLSISGVVINSSSKNIDLDKLASEIKNQLENVYTFSRDGISVSMEANIRAISNIKNAKLSDHIFNVVNVVSPKNKNAIANTNKLGGLRINLGTRVVGEILSGKNTRTVAHELGHSGGLEHTNYADYKDTNLMTQIIYLSRNVNKNKAINLRTDQINELRNNYISDKLNIGTSTEALFNFQRYNDMPFLTFLHKFLDL